MSTPESHSPPPEDLTYRVELWRDGGSGGVERVLARAASMQLAHAIFRAARQEHPKRRVTLSDGREILADSEGS
ncbi:MAG: hypothetical protein ACOY4R_06980 [Pseudomonadota bacterium]